MYCEITEEFAAESWKLWSYPDDIHVVQNAGGSSITQSAHVGVDAVHRFSQIADNEIKAKHYNNQQHTAPKIIFITIAHLQKTAHSSAASTTLCPKKHVTTFSTITLTVSVRLQ